MIYDLELRTVRTVGSNKLSGTVGSGLTVGTIRLELCCMLGVI